MANENGWGDGASNNDIGWGKGADNAIGWGSVYSVSSAGLTDIVGVTASSLLLDTYTDAAVAYSLRKLRTAYSGSAIRVRRSSDNTSQDIGFVGNDLDTASLLTFVGAGNGFVSEWYDQSGNGLNSSQGTALNQPRIVNAGVLDVKNLKPGFRFDGSNDYFTRAALSALNSGNTYSIFSVAANDDTNTLKDIICTAALGTANRFNLFIDTRTSGGSYNIATIQNTLSSVYPVSLPALDGSTNQRLQTVVVNGFNMAGWKNGIAGGTNTYAGTYANNTFDIGTFINASRFLKGYVQELVIYPSDQTTNRTSIESNINSFYTIY